MTPANPDALAEALARTLFERGRKEGGIDPATWEDAGDEMRAWLRGHADAMLSGPLAPLLADLQRVTAERDEAKARGINLREGIRDAADEATHHRNNCLIAQREKAAAEARAAQLQAEVEHEKALRERAQSQCRDWCKDRDDALERFIIAIEERDALRAEVEALKGALKPFAEALTIIEQDEAAAFHTCGDEFEICSILPSGEAPALLTVGDLRAARTALAARAATAREG